MNLNVKISLTMIRKSKSDYLILTITLPQCTGKQLTEMYRAAYVIRKEKTAMLVVDPMRRTILNLLADKAYTQSQIAGIVGLMDASVGHHIRILERAKLVKVVKREVEAHGIMQRFYRSVALCIVVDTERMSKSVSKYFFPVNIERLRGALAALQYAKKKIPEIDTTNLERISELLAVFIAREATKISAKKVTSDRETITTEIYRRALSGILRLRL